MSITGSNNPFACEPVVFANANSIISLGTITRSGNQFTFSVGFVWKINGVTYQNTTPVVITIAEASTGFQRIDNALLNTSNTIELQQGLESETIALQPIAPPTAIILTSFDIDGGVIDEPSSPITGSQFKQKNESQKFTQVLGGTNAVINLQTYGQQYYSIVGPVTSIAGFSKALLTATPTAEVPYGGKDFYFENKTDHNVTLKNAFSPVDIPFNLGADLIVPTNGIVWLKYNPNTEKMDLFFKSWTDLSGAQFKKKLESEAYADPILTGANAVIHLQPNGQSVYSFSNTGLTSIDGFGLDLITGNPSAEVPYPGKDILIYNNKAENLTLKHDGSGTADVKFLLEGSVDLVVPPGGKVWLKYGPSYCELIFKSWSNIDLSTKADLVGGKVPASQLPSYVVNDITGLQTALDGKQNLLSSFDESILIEDDGNIEGNVSLFEEYFEQQECELNFTPIQIIGVYLNGIKQKQSLYTIIPPKKISVTNFVANDYIEIQYTKLKI